MGEPITFKKLNIPIKKILIGIGILIIIGSLGFNIYVGLQAIKNQEYQRGLLDGANNIVQQIKNGIRVNFDEGVILFVPKQ